MGRLRDDVPQEFPASGNIAHVLRQARASLKDPSRPFTPTERRLRSTKSLFGEVEFRPTKTENTRRRSSSRSSRSGRNDDAFLSRKRLGSDHPAGEPKQPAQAHSEALRRENVGSASQPRKGSSKTAPTRRRRAVDLSGHHVDRATSAEWSLGSCKTAFGVRATTDAAILPDGVDHRVGRPSLSPLDAPSLPAVDLGILYVDGACSRRGSMSRSVVSQGSSSSSSSSVTSARSSIHPNGETTPPKENNEYEGLYGSDEDLDTSAWNLGAGRVCSSDAQEEEEEEEDEETVKPASKLVPQDDGDDNDAHICLDFVLDAIDNEVDLDNASSSGVSTDGCSDASPDPGAAEGQRKRNARLAELMRMLRGSLDAAKITMPKNDNRQCAHGARGPTTGSSGETDVANALKDDDRHYAHGAHEPTFAGGGKGVAAHWSQDSRSSTLLDRTRDVLLRVMDRPRGPADASPSSVTELPGLLAASLAIGLTLPLPLVAQTGVEIDPRNIRRPRGGTKEGGEHVTRACRHLFEVSKKAGADRAFFSSGTVTCLLEFIELVATEVNALSGATAAAQHADGSLPSSTLDAGQCPDGNRRNSGGDFDGGVIDLDCSTSNSSREGGSSGSSSSGGSSGRSGSLSRRGNIRKRSADSANLYIESMCDALTYAVGCLKNVSGSGSLQHRLVQAGAVNAFCGLVRSIRDLCRRCDDFQRQASQPRPTNYTEELASVSPGPSGENIDGGGGGGGGQWEPHVDTLRKRVSPPLAHTISLLRDLAVGKDGRHDDFRAAGAVSILSSVLRPFRDQLDVVLNAARALVKLSLQKGMGDEIAEDAAHVRDLLAALVEQGGRVHVDFSGLKENYGDSGHLQENALGFSGNSSVTVSVEQRRYWEREEKRVAACIRIAFILGNMTSQGEDSRKLIGLRLGGVESLPGLLEASSRAHLSAWECLCAVGGSVSVGCNNVPGDQVLGMAKKGRTLDMGAAYEESWSRKILRRACNGLDEMLVKTVRLLANISINRAVGQLVCCHPGLVAVEPLLGKCLEVFELFEDGVLPPHVPRLQHGGGVGDDRVTAGPGEELIPGEELLLNVVSLVANLSFYGTRINDRLPVHACSDSSVELRGSYVSSDGSTASTSTVDKRAFPNILFGLASKARRSADESALPATSTNSVGGDARQTVGGKGSGGVGSSAPSHGPANDRGNARREVLTGHLVKLLLHPNAEAVAEAARAFGNFSRDPSCREAMARRRADEVLVALLRHTCREVVFAAAGALVNVAADPARKALLSREGVDAGGALARLVRRAGLSDPSMAEIACQALHNLLIEPVPAGGALEVLGGVEIYKKLWWTLRELVEACSNEGGVGAQVDSDGSPCTDGVDEEGLSCVRGFTAAAAAVLRAMGSGSVDSTCAALNEYFV